MYSINLNHILELTQEVKPITLEWAFKVAINLALKLQEYRQKKLIHRDIKLSNIIVDEDGNVHIIDKGISVGYDDVVKYEDDDEGI